MRRVLSIMVWVLVFNVSVYILRGGGAASSSRSSPITEVGYSQLLEVRRRIAPLAFPPFHPLLSGGSRHAHDGQGGIWLRARRVVLFFVLFCL
jgi:hypothetical protein